MVILLGFCMFTTVFEPVLYDYISTKSMKDEFNTGLEHYSPTLNNMAPSKENIYTQRYSRFVNMMKFLLPIIALILISLIFLWPNLNPDDLKFKLSFSALKLNILNQPSLVNPRYYSADSSNQNFSITADLVKRQKKVENGENTEILRLDRPKADIMMKDGTWLVLTAEKGVFTKSEQKLDLEGNVNLFHDSGFEFSTSKAQFNLENGTAKGINNIKGQGPFGQLRGEGFHLLNKGQIFYITGKSSLVIYPKTGKTVK